MASNEKTLEKTLKVYEFIKKFTAENGFPPSIRDICTALNISSTATVSYYVNKLDEMGYIKKLKNKNRAMEVLSDNQSSEIKIQKLLSDYSYSYTSDKNFMVTSKAMFSVLPDLVYVVTDEDKIDGYFEGDCLFLKKCDLYPAGSLILTKQNDGFSIVKTDIDIDSSGENAANIYGKIIKVLKEIK